MKAYTGLHPYAFMSYSHKDEERIKPLIDRLQGVGCNIWYDEGILPADEWAETIAKKLAGASLFFLVLSNNSVASQNVKREIYYAVSNDLPILTFYLEDVKLSQGLSMQLGISQAIHTENNSERDYNTLKSSFPTEIKTGDEPEIIHSTPNYNYAFSKSAHKNEYSIMKINRETRERTELFRHIDSTAFDGWYTCESRHYASRDEFTSWGANTLFFSVYSDLDHEPGVAASDLYIQVDFAITNPNSESAEIHVVGGRKKVKSAPFSETEEIADTSTAYWTKNYIKN